jgi:hypothetical protein
MTDFDIPDNVLDILENKNNYTHKKNEEQTFYDNLKKSSFQKTTSKLIQSNLNFKSEKLYPLFRNYPNGSEDYYLKLNCRKNKIKVLFFSKNIFNYKIYNYLESKNYISEKKFDLIVTTHPEKAKRIKTEAPIVFINCKPEGFIDKNRMYYFYNKTKLLNELKSFLIIHEIKYMYRKNLFDIVEFFYKITKGENLD